MHKRLMTAAVHATLIPAALALAQPAAAESSKAREPRASSASAGSSAHAQLAPANVRATDLVGKDLVDLSNREIGEIRNLLVRMNDDAQIVALATFDDIDSTQGRIYAVPMSKLAPSGDKDKLILDMPRSEVRKLKSWGERDRLDWTNLSWWTGERNAERPGPASGFYTFKASDMIGMTVEARNAQDLGELEDLVIDMHRGRASYAVISFDPGVLSAERNLAVPIKHFVNARASGPTDPQRLVVDLSRADLQAMRGFGDNDWPDFNGRSFLSWMDERFTGESATAGAGGGRPRRD